MSSEWIDEFSLHSSNLSSDLMSSHEYTCVQSWINEFNSWIHMNLKCEFNLELEFHFERVRQVKDESMHWMWFHWSSEWLFLVAIFECITMANLYRAQASLNHFQICSTNPEGKMFTWSNLWVRISWKTKGWFY